MNRRNPSPPTVEASPGAPLSPLDAPGDDNRHRHRLMQDIKLLFAALGAGGSAVPMGDNGHATHRLASLVACLREQ